MTSYEDFKTKLDEVYTWPSSYQFKFVVPVESKPDLLQLMPIGELEERWSKNQRYVSVSLKTVMPSSEAIVAVYQRVAHIGGIVSL